MSGCFFSESKSDSKCPEQAKLDSFEVSHAALAQLKSSVTRSVDLVDEIDKLMRLASQVRTSVANHATSIRSCNRQYKEGLMGVISYAQLAMDHSRAVLSNQTILPLYSASEQTVQVMSNDAMSLVASMIRGQTKELLQLFAASFDLLDKNKSSVERPGSGLLLVDAVILEIKTQCRLVFRCYDTIISKVSMDIGVGPVDPFGVGVLAGLESTYAASALSFDNSYGWAVFGGLGFIFFVIISLTLFICFRKAGSFGKSSTGGS
jgi:hypothetical protein